MQSATCRWEKLTRNLVLQKGRVWGILPHAFCLFVCFVEPAPEAAHRGGAEAAEQLEEEEFGASHGGGGGGREQQLHS